MTNVNIEYQYRTNTQIKDNVKKISDFGIIEIIVLILFLMVIVVKILYIFPCLKIIKNLKIKDSERKNKKLSLKQIIITKEIETEIENELKNEQKNEIKEKLSE